MCTELDKIDFIGYIILVPLITFVLGMLIGVAGVFLLDLGRHRDKAPEE